MTDEEAGALLCALLERIGERVTLSEQDMVNGLAAARTRLRTQMVGRDVAMWLEPPAALRAALDDEAPR